MPHLKCLACKTRLRSAESQGDPIWDLCPVCRSVGDLGEIVGYRVIETRGGTSHRGVSRVGGVIAGGGGEIVARRGLKPARVREVERCDADSVSRQAQAVSSRAPGHGRRSRETPARSHDRRAAASAARSSELSMTGVIGANGHGAREFALRRRPRVGWRAA